MSTVAASRKAAIVGLLGEKELLLPDLVRDALAANGRAKYLFSLLQLAKAHADGVAGDVPDLRLERELAGIDDASLDAVARESRCGRRGGYDIPFAKRIVERIFADVDRMLRPIRAASPTRVDEGVAVHFERRFAWLSAACRTYDDRTIDAETIALLTSSDRRADSVHLLVLDLHKAVDALAASLATDDIDGAKAFGLTAADRPLVAAFMRGVHATEAAKLGHPGLGTMATRRGDVLVLENDLGETSAHVLVVRIEGLRVVVTSTDVHLQRVEFFQRMLDGTAVSWADVRSRPLRELDDVGLFYECIGTLLASNGAELEEFLARLGSRLVFLIDWNRARKALRAFVPKAESLALLDWAADEGCGHRGLLEMGGAELVLDALAAVVRTPLRFGERLDDILGPRAAAELLRFVLRTCSLGLRAARSRSLMRAEIRAELGRFVEAGGDRLLGPLAEHAAIVHEMASALRDHVSRRARSSAATSATTVDAARTREKAGDDRVVFMSDLARRIPEAEAYREVIALADDAADALEEATFRLSLLPPRDGPIAALGEPLVELTDLVVGTASAYAAGVTAARRGGRDGLQGVLDAFDAIKTLEQRMDDAERRFVSSLAIEPAVSGKLFVTASRIAEEIERAVDAMTRAALLLREHVASPG